MKLLYPLILLLLSCSTEPEDEFDYNLITYNWQLDSYSVENTEINLFGQAGSSCCIYDLSRNWDFQENGKITVDKVNQFYPDGTGEIIEGDWNIIGDKINIFFEPNLDYYDFSSDSTFIM
ncbi:hypothetical protein N9263_00785, partial [Candidatus Marinimicrobia bacterium]|nr:hypothetical protein [Candidatus Neomarinimicrobiota bacterium]